MLAYEKWLGDLAGGTTWVDEMKSHEAKMQDNAPVPTSFFNSVFLRMNMIH